jgi:DNA primase
VVFCFDGDSAGRRAAWRALENALPVLADGKNAAFLFLPEGEDPDDFVRKRGKSAFEALVDRAQPASEFLISELSAQHPPTTVEGRAALVTAARPYLAQIAAPVLGALLRRHLAAISGLPEPELRSLLRQGSSTGSRAPDRALTDENERRPARVAKPPKRRSPSLFRELIQALLLQPELARSTAVPQPADGTSDGEALAALVGYCRDCEHPLTTAFVMQHFADSPHDRVFSDALAAADENEITPELAIERLTAGVARYWQQARREGLSGGPEAAMTTAEEVERLRQLEIVRRSLRGVEAEAPGRRS